MTNAAKPQPKFELDAGYLARGYITPCAILTPAEVVHYRGVFDDIEKEMGQEKAAIGVVKRHLTDREIWNLAVHPKVLAAVTRALGPDLVLLGTHFFVKYPSTVEKFVAWHQDVTYWGLEPGIASTIWLAIDDADVENGCMRVIEGSHLGGQLPHGKSERPGNLLSVNQEVSSTVDESRAVDIILKAGEASVHHGLLIHGSNPNRSNRRRCGLTIRFTTPEVRMTGAFNWTTILVQGEDRFGNMQHAKAPF